MTARAALGLIARGGPSALSVTAVAREVGAVGFGLGDICDPDYCREYVKKTALRKGRMDVLVNNAGTIVREDTADTTDEQWQETMAINVNAVFYMSREALKVMRAKGSGAIVNLSSTCGLVGSQGLTAYCASKGGLVLLTKAMAKDHARDGLRVNAVCPGYTRTERVEEMLTTLRTARSAMSATRAERKPRSANTMAAASVINRALRSLRSGRGVRGAIASSKACGRFSDRPVGHVK